MALKMSMVALLIAVSLVVAVVAEEKWQDNVSAAAGGVKDKADDAVDGAKSWTDWAVGKFSKKVKEEKEQTASEKIGEAKDKVVKMAVDTQDKANEAYESAKGSVTDHAKAGIEAAKEKAVGAQQTITSGHNEL